MQAGPDRGWAIWGSRMSKHERYDELSILAAIGDTSASDLSDLRKHLDECVDCRGDYKKFSEVVLPQLTLPDSMVPKTLRATSGADARSVRSRFLERAQAAGISFSPQTLEPAPPHVVEREKPKHANVFSGWSARGAIAASLILAVGAGGYQIARMQGRDDLARSATPIAGSAQFVQETAGTVPSATTRSQSDTRVSSSVQSEDAKRIVEVEQLLRSNLSQLAAERAKIDSLESDSAALRDKIDRRQQLLSSAEMRAQAAEQAAADLRVQLDKAQSRAGSNEAAWLLDEVKVKDLGDQLAQARETLAASHEVGNLMAERNLHIVDVYDTDGEGKTKPIFGRIFLTGNKRLLFYAYDLNESRLENAKYAYRVWGAKLGPGQSARALGAFYADDPAQKRWVFDYDDPKVLAEIDSVFVTFEPTAKESDHPRGPKLMYAYLRGDANHP